ncbi:MAG: aminotransferase class III-fold pyridoxal phosphate-dependent enzyme [Desulfamplus sp.]|nr:aminotransferase class III-fold pyridoxal phosphate-dependent enzyme [Desulfamplus sp.]
MKNKIFNALAEIVKNASGVDMNQVDITEDYFSLGFDSLVVVRIDQEIRKQFNIEIDAGLYYEELDSLERLLHYLTERLPHGWREMDTPSTSSPLPSSSPESALPQASPDTALYQASPESALPQASPESTLYQASPETHPTSAIKGYAPRDYPSSPPEHLPPQELFRESLADRKENFSAVEKLLSYQMQAMSELMHKQLDILGSYGTSAYASAPGQTSSAATPSQAHAAAPSKAHAVVPSQVHAAAPSQAHASTPSKAHAVVPSQDHAAAPSKVHISASHHPKGASTPQPPPEKPRISDIRSMKFDPDQLTPSQQAFVNDLIPAYVQRTRSSKEYAGQYRPFLADWINTLGFRRSIKEIIYPIVTSRSAGSKIWDIDGNQYLDMAMGYGVSLFGHAPGFVTRAIQEQLEKGMELGPQSAIVGEVSALISEITGMERVAFCNTGSEAVMVALRVAQNVTGRERIALFTGSFHGNADMVIKDTLALRYGHESALAIIREKAHELAAILVEPVQSRNPGLQPREFLHELRALTKELGIILVFDEMINGFRCHPGGAQAVFGVRADMVTYGKAVAGGMPIGIVAGSNRCMKSIDGGLWNYGDESVPGREVIFFGGTFCKHPLTMAASRAALIHMKTVGPALQEALTVLSSSFFS